MLKLYNDYKAGKKIDDCWSITEDDNHELGSYYIKHPIKEENCPIFQSADYNVFTIDQISSFSVIETPTKCIEFDRCKENEFWSKPFKIDC